MNTTPQPEPNTDHQERYQRQSLFAPLGRRGDSRLRQSSVLIIGCGALGSHLAVLLSRAGVGSIRLVDRDVVEWSNLHRQVEFTEEDARRSTPKAAALAAHLRESNSEILLEPLVTDFNAGTALELAKGVEILLDGTDNLPSRFLINDLSLLSEIPWIYAGAVGEEAHVQFFLPRAGPCLRCVLRDLPAPGALPTCDTAGVIGPSAAAAASFQAAMALRYLAHPEEAPALAGLWVRLRLWHIDTVTTRVKPDPQCPACQGGRLDLFTQEEGPRTQVLCGRNAVQVLPARRKGLQHPVNLKKLGQRLVSTGEIAQNDFLLRFQPRTAGPSITIFRDGRAIVGGTMDKTLAQTLYDRYVGQ